MLDIRWAKCRLQSPWLMRPIPFSLKIQSKWEIVSIYLIREKEGVHTIPMFVSANQSIVEISASAEHTCVLSENGSISCWGRNNYGQLGLGHTGERNTPNQLDWNIAPFSSIYGPAPVEKQHLPRKKTGEVIQIKVSLQCRIRSRSGQVCHPPCSLHNVFLLGIAQFFFRSIDCFIFSSTRHIPAPT